MMPGWLEPPFDWNKAAADADREARRLLMRFYWDRIVQLGHKTFLHNDWEERLRAMTSHHVDLSLLDLTYTYDPDASFFIAIT